MPIPCIQSFTQVSVFRLRTGTRGWTPARSRASRTSFPVVCSGKWRIKGSLASVDRSILGYRSEGDWYPEDANGWSGGITRRISSLFSSSYSSFRCSLVSLKIPKSSWSFNRSFSWIEYASSQMLTLTFGYFSENSAIICGIIQLLRISGTAIFNSPSLFSVRYFIGGQFVALHIGDRFRGMILGSLEAIAG